MVFDRATIKQHVTLRFEHPAWLLLTLLALPMAYSAIRLFTSMSLVRRWSAAVFRVLLIALLSGMLAGATSVRKTDRLAVIAAGRCVATGRIGDVLATAGVGTLVAEGKEIRDFDGESYVMERGLVADLAIIHAWKADREGNLVYRKTARNFNPVMATAAKITVAEVEHLVEPSAIDPDHIHTPGIFVKRLVRCPTYEKRIEQRTVRKRGN